MNVRRVVTGHDRSGKSVFLSDEAVEPLSLDALPGLAFHRLWAQDAPPAIPAVGICEEWSTYFPPVGGVRFVITTFPPEAAAQPPGDLDVAAALAELEQKLPGLAAHMEPDDPGMHTSDTIDFDILLSRQLTLELDDGEQRLLRPGDTVVQNGTHHRWTNRSTEPAVLAVVIVGADRARS